MANNAFSGAHYLSKGFGHLLRPGIRSYVLIPLFINFILLGAACIYLFSAIDDQFTSWKNSEYSLVQWIVENLGWLLWPLIVISLLIVVFFVFAMLANWIAAPFNGLLAEAVEKHLSGNNFVETQFNWAQFFKDIPRLFAREFRKLRYYLPRAILCLLLFWTPVFFIAPIIWFLFNAWMAAIQYIDYPMDNHRAPFQQVIDEVKVRRSGSMGFGSLVMLLTMVPLANIIVMPAAVAGATHLWFDHIRRP